MCLIYSAPVIIQPLLWIPHWRNTQCCWMELGLLCTCKTVMTSSNGNTFRITGPLCGGIHQSLAGYWQPSRAASSMSLNFFSGSHWRSSTCEHFVSKQLQLCYIYWLSCILWEIKLLSQHLPAKWAFIDLTQLPQDKMATISEMIFSDAFLWMKNFVFWSNFMEVCSQGYNWQ